MNRGAIWKTSIEGWINNLFQIYDWGNHSFQNTFFLGTNITTNIETAALSIHPLPLLLRQTGKRGKKVDQTILVSLYTRPPFGQWTFGNNTLQKGDSRRCRAYKNFLKHLILADYSKNICRRGIFVQSPKLKIVCCLSTYSLWIKMKYCLNKK